VLASVVKSSNDIDESADNDISVNVSDVEYTSDVSSIDAEVLLPTTAVVIAAAVAAAPLSLLFASLC
jgi:hypothetical protein